MGSAAGPSHAAAQHHSSAVLSLPQQRERLTRGPGDHKNARGLLPRSEEGIRGGRGVILVSASKKDSIRSRLSCWRTGRDTGHMAAGQVTSIGQGDREPLYIPPPQLRMTLDIGVHVHQDINYSHFHCHLQDDMSCTTQVLLLQTTVSARLILSH